LTIARLTRGGSRAKPRMMSGAHRSAMKAARSASTPAAAALHLLSEPGRPSKNHAG